MVKFEHGTPNKKANKHIPLSATLIAGVLLAFSPDKHVMAQEIEEDNSESEFEEISAKYHSLLNQINQEDDEQISSDLEVETQRVLSVEEVKDIQNQLILFLENEGATDLAATMQAEVTTVEELEELLGSLLEKSAVKDLDSELLEENEEGEKSIVDSELLEENEEVEELVEDSELVEETEEVEESIEDSEPLEETEEVEESIEDSEPLEETEEVEESVEDSELVEETEEVEESIEDSEPLEETEEVEESIEDSEPLEETEEFEESVEDSEQVEEAAKEEPVEVETAQPEAFSVKTTAEKSISYTVRAGDTLYKIAREHNVSVNHIAKLNNITNINHIRVGQVLTIHGKKVENTPADSLENLDKSMTNNEFIEYLGKHASVAAKEQNLYASVMIAQAALESGFGTSGLSSAPNYNLYGMKGTYQGNSVVMRTREYSDAKGWHYVNAHFKKYPSYLESLLDHAGYIRRGPSWGPQFYSGVWLENTTSYRDATSWLQGRYATDPNYASKLNQIIERYNLTRFDYIIDEDDLVVQPPTDNNQPEQDVKPSPGDGDKEADNTPEDTNLSNYRVKRGDTLWHIARAHNMSVRELKELNNLKSDLILVGQNLKVKTVVAESKPTPTPTPEPTPTPKPDTPSESDSTSYTVKRGDTLSHIALAHNMSVRELKELNNLKSDLILIGQKLKVKETVAESKPTPTPTPEPTPTPDTPSESDSTNYTVKRGDTLWHIAHAHKMSVRELKELNNLKFDLILIGQKLKVKKNVVTPSTKPKPETPSASNITSYTVKRGDTLWHIAHTYQMSVRELKEINNLKSDLILVGQPLKIKQKDTVTNKPTVQSYQIKAGDTLSHLAIKFNTTVASLKAKNNLKSDLIFVNQQLII